MACENDDAGDEKLLSSASCVNNKFSAEKLNLSHITAHRDIITFARLFNAYYFDEEHDRVRQRMGRRGAGEEKEKESEKEREII